MTRTVTALLAAFLLSLPAAASAQLGYMVGAAWGGIVLAVAGFGTLGFVLLAGMALSAYLVTRVDDRNEAMVRF